MRTAALADTDGAAALVDAGGGRSRNAVSSPPRDSSTSAPPTTVASPFVSLRSAPPLSDSLWDKPPAQELAAVVLSVRSAATGLRPSRTPAA